MIEDNDGANSALIPRPAIARAQLEVSAADTPAPTVIRPTVGRIVWYWPHGRDRNASIVDLSPPARASQPMAATVCYVWGDRRVNLLVTDHVGRQHTRDGVQLVQDGDERPRYGVDAYATWMPYQLGQAKREAAGTVSPAERAASEARLQAYLAERPALMAEAERRRIEVAAQQAGQAT